MLTIDEYFMTILSPIDYFIAPRAPPGIAPIPVEIVEAAAEA
jgi:hypothetical protein